MSFLEYSRLPLAATAALFVLLNVVGDAQSQDDPSGKLAVEFDQLAQKVAGYLKGDENATTIAVGAFTGQPQFSTSSGRKMQKMLSDELKKHGIEDSRQSRLSCKGEYFFLDAEQREQNGGSMVLIRLTISEGLRDKNRYDCKIADVDDVADLFAPPSLKLNPGATGKQREEQLAAKIDGFAPPKQGTVQGGPAPAEIEGDVRLSSGKGSNYAVEIHVRRDNGYVPQPLTDDAGLTFVDNLSLDDTYGVYVVNRSPHYAAVTLTIDGLNMFEFCQIPHYKQLGKLVIPPGKKYLIKGWYFDDGDTRTFKINDDEKTVPGELQGLNRPEVGTISVKFAAAVPGGERLPPDEQGVRPLRTVPGEKIFGINFAPRPMNIGVTREVLSIRYNRPLPP